jgi:mono/diheme cytochrome c family protein/ketosteroid isomerase-like protein
MKKNLCIGMLGIVVVGLLWMLLGGYNIAATEPHWKVTEALLELIRERSIHQRSADIKVPNLNDQAMILSGASNYDAMCATCHLAPGIEDSELHAGLYPQPPKLFDPEHERHDPAAIFWVIKNGIKMTGMPAWGPTHDDEAIWSMVAFLQKLPDLDAASYRQLVDEAKRSGHVHGGPEHHHEEGAAPDAEVDGHHDHHEAPAPESAEEHAHGHDSHEHQHHGAPEQESESDHIGHHDDSPDSVMVSERMRAWAEAVDRKDVDAMGRLVLDDASFRVVEGSHENLGWENYLETHLKPEFKAMDAFSYRLLKSHVDIENNTAVVSFSYEITAKMGNRELHKISKGTAIWKKVQGEWLLHYIHTS